MTTKKVTVTPVIERNIVFSENLFENDLQLHDKLPEGLMHFEYLERLVMDRLMILRAVESIVDAGKYVSIKMCRKVLAKRLRSIGFESFASLCEGTGCGMVDAKRYSARTKDHTSHVILLLAMCQSSNTRDWICRMEGLLFEWRLSAMDNDGIDGFMKANDLTYPVLDEDEKRRMKSQLKPLMKHPSLFSSTTFYKVPAVEMLRSGVMHHVYFKEGVAYVQHYHLRIAFLYQYKSRLQSRIEKFIGAHNFMIDPRIRLVVQSVQKQFASLKPTSWSASGTKIEKLDEIAKEDYPPCMRNLHDGLRRTHHLRNKGRVQYTVFLRAIGVRPEDAVALYKSEFTKKISVKDFDKEYPYIFRFLYGLVGSKKPYEVLNCWKIAAEKPASNEFHGCPLTTTDIEDLGKMLTRWNIEPAAKRDIVDKVKKKDRGKACAGYFAAIHKRPVIYPIVNPKDFYRQSTQLRESGDVGQGDTVPAKPDDVESDGCKNSVPSASSEEKDDSEDECQIVGEVITPMAAKKYKKMVDKQKIAKIRAELVEFYLSACESKEPGGSKSGTSNAMDEWSYLHHVFEHFKDPEDEMEED